MTPRRTPPLLLYGGLSGRVFIATRYSARRLKDGRDQITTHEKYDVTEDFLRIARQMKAAR